MKNHYYKAAITWTGNLGAGTSDYRAYGRNYTISVNGKPEIPGSSDPSFRGDPARYNPEELLIVSLSTCHMLWYLHLCSEAAVVVVAYADEATGVMEETPDGGGHFASVTLNPSVILSAKSMIEKATELHQKANQMCFIANSVNFPVHHQPIFKIYHA
jgi:organic hydroperoxide reductase OsmC/OhrA